MLDLIIFGGAGDLALRKLLPSLYYLYKDDKLPKSCRITCISRAMISDDDFLKLVENKLAYFLKDDFNDTDWQAFKGLLKYQNIDLSGADDWHKLVNQLSIDPQDKNRDIIYYLSVPPTLFAPICEQIKAHQLNPEYARLVVEKPLGEDYQSAILINDVVAESFSEKQIYRIDHYLGKPAVQNIPKLRFDDGKMEEIWNKDHIKSVEITISETVGVEDRAEFLDRAGILRDMVQNHIMQLLCYVAMEKPKSFGADHIRDAKLNLINALCPIDESNIVTNSIRGQYEQGYSDGKVVPSYQQDIMLSKNKVAGDGETYVALKVNINNKRWQDVDFYLTTGKRLSARFGHIIINFKDREPLKIKIKYPLVSPNQLRIAKAYEVLILDIIKGQQTYFVRGDEIMASWKWIDKIRSVWEKTAMPMSYYKAGSKGPRLD